MYSAETVAKHMINWYSKTKIYGVPVLTNWRLNKLLYFLQGEYLKTYGKRLIDNEFYAWEFGPVMPSVYYKYNMYASSALPKQDISTWIDEKDKYFIECFLFEYLFVKTSTLCELSQSQDPWRYTVKVFGKGTIIPFGCFENYFKTK